MNQALAAIGSGSIPTQLDLRRWLNSPPLQSGLDHWHLWTLICLHRHLNRQRWVGYIVETRLKGELGRIGSAGAFGHPESIPQQGPVPDEPGWHYFFHGRGCCLTHCVTGTIIDVDFTDDGTPDRIDRYFYSSFLESLKEPEFPEQQLRRSNSLRHAWQVNVEGLADAGCLELCTGSA